MMDLSAVSWEIELEAVIEDLRTLPFDDEADSDYLDIAKSAIDLLEAVARDWDRMKKEQGVKKEAEVR